jgi:flagellar biogenesis protein FliO
MPYYSFTIRVMAFLVAVTLSCAAPVFAADPRIVRTSHEVDAKSDLKDESEVKESTPSNEDETTYSPQWPEPPNTGAMLTRLCVGTFIVLALCAGTLWFGKPWLQRLQVAGAGPSAMTIEGSVAVGNRAMLYLVRVGGTQLVAGTDATGLKSLIALPASFKEVLDEQIPEAETATDPLPTSTARVFGRPEVKE